MSHEEDVAAKAYLGAFSHIQRFLDSVSRVHDSFYVHAVSVLALRNASGGIDVPDGLRPESVSDFIEKAEREISEESRHLFWHAVPGLWSVLEAALSDFVYEVLERCPYFLHREPLASLQVRIGDYELLESAEKARFVVQRAQLRVNADAKQGVGKFEWLLGLVGLSGSVDPEIRRAFVELYAVRNLVAHRAGVVDRRFKEDCPWVTAGIGELFVVSYNMLDTYSSIVIKYVDTVVLRIKDAWDRAEKRRIAREAAQPPSIAEQGSTPSE